MQVEIKIDKKFKEPQIIIVADKMTEEIDAVFKILSESGYKIIAGFSDNIVTMLEEKDIIKIYASCGKVYAMTDKGEYLLKLRLYEIEEKFSGASFVRISNSELINLKKVKSFDLSITGTILVRFSDGSSSYASRRYVSKIKKILGI